jgi:hypothetical protein
MIAPLRRRQFRLLWTGLTVSLLGDGVFMVAVAWQAYSVSDHPSALAYVGLATSLPQVIFLLLGGTVADRVSRRRVLLWADVVRAAAVMGLALLVADGDAGLGVLCLVGAVIGTATAFASPALDALVPQIVPDSELTQANVVDQFVRPAALQLAGPAVGGLAVALLHTSGAFYLDAATFVFSAFCVASMAPAPVSNLAGGRMWQQMTDGLRYVKGRVWLWGTFACATITYLLFLGPTQVLLPFIVRNSLHRGASTYGVILAAGGVGALAGALLAGRVGQPRRPMTWIFGWWTLATLAVAGYGLATNSWGLVCVAVIVNGAEAVGAVAWATLKQMKVDNAMLGRVSSIDWCISTALLPASYALTAPVARLLGPRPTLVVAGALGAAVTLAFLFLPGMRETVAGIEAESFA